MATPRTIITRIIILAVTVLLVALVFRTVYLSHAAHAVQECKQTDADFIPLTDERLKRFQRALQFETVSWDEDDGSYDDLYKFGEFIINSRFSQI